MRSYNKGFSLVELLIVMIIIGLLASLVGPAMFGKVDSSKVKTAQAQMQLLATAIDTYRLDNDAFPESLEGLRKSSGPRWDGPYLPKDVPLDPWDNPYFYQQQGNSYTLMSLGRDGKQGGEELDSDIVYQ
ncbi:type II secretion system major pseudopilin GspG [Pseudoalteromonas sp. MMG024]|uniref:type II secretion system major pseudopilin GspG n=1 Tax=Pseudoalteromonas sp. MMG024 TaxID=2909980 RepID=UPI0031BA850E|nr:type II secretion system major pseudopilin GspG [Pseudoalteromonas sp. MMG024]